MKVFLLLAIYIFNSKWFALVRQTFAGRTNRNKQLTSLLCISALLLSNGAGAAMVNISFSGDITSISDPSSELASNGFDTSVTSFTGLISYDSTLAPLFTSTIVTPNGNGLQTLYGPTTAFVTIDGFDFSVSDLLIVRDFAPGTNTDPSSFSGADMLFKSTAGSPSVSNCIGAFSTCGLNIALADTTGTEFSNTSLPTNVDLADFDIHYIQVNASNASGLLYEINGNITSLAVTAVPLPPALWLFGTGMLGLIGISSRKKAA
ncbi:MAG: hypothetical protein OEU74_02050 [Gammaproteobacteria bacterium]|nr:hypothetical protein [Gammaproteobacteria bacterium]